jgi:hypothetical protein
MFTTIGATCSTRSATDDAVGTAPWAATCSVGTGAGVPAAGDSVFAASDGTLALGFELQAAVARGSRRKASRRVGC